MPTRRMWTRAITWLLIAGMAFLSAGCKADDTAPAGELAGGASVSPASGGSYDDLLALWREFREFQKPRVTGGVPDYTAAAMAAQKSGILGFQDRLAAIRPAGWPVERRVDYEIVKAELNGLDFDHRVLRPWSRIPGFYAVIQTSEPDVPLREGPEIHGVLDLWKLEFPLDESGRAVLREKLAAIPAVLAQAKKNLVEDTADLWLLGIRQKRDESLDLERLGRRLGPTDPGLVPLVDTAKAAVDDFRAWLEEGLKTKKGPSGIGVAEYDWYQKHVHLVPYTWAEQLAIAERELERSLAYLELERARNAGLPPLRPAADLAELQARQKAAVARFFDFLRRRPVFTVPDYMRLDDDAGPYAPPERRDYFTQVIYRDPLPLVCHSVHWLEKQRERRNSHPVRGTALLYNIWDSRAEGFATAFEEMMLGAGLFDPNPRARELVLNLLAFRAVRAIADLRLHSGEWTAEEAVRYAVRTTPEGWVLADGDTIWGDLAIYLGQPGYGTSYVTGKVQVEKLLADCAALKGGAFDLGAFLDDFFSRGLVPQSLIRWEMTGLDDEMKRLLSN
jgi:Bacterial protein of unknown function (DUF885)